MRKIKSINSLALFLLVILAVFLPPVTAKGEIKVHKWKCQSFLPPGNWANTKLKELLGKVKEETQGRLDITLYPVGSLVPSADIAKATQKGVIQWGFTSPGYDLNKVPVLRFIFGVPGFNYNYADFNALVFNYGLEELVQNEVLEKMNLYYFSYVMLPTMLITNNKPVKSINDMKGLKIRSLAAIADWLRDLGASTVYIPGQDVYMALSTGTIDGAHWGAFEGALGPKLNEVAKYFVTPYLSYGVQSCFYINKQAFDALPKDLQNYLRYTLLKEALRMTKDYLDQEKRCREIWLKTATESHISESDQIEMSQLGMQIMKKYVVDDATKTAYDMLVESNEDRELLPWGNK